MPARRTSWHFRGDRAEVGVGTLIVFIAMVLVAAVAAAVIISTSGTLQERAMSTGKDATADVSSNFKIVSIYGERPASTGGIEELHFLLELSAGAPDVDLSTLILRYSDGTNVDIYTLNTAPTYNLSWIRGSGSGNVMETGDLVDLSFTVASGALIERSEFELSIVPELGNSVHLSLKTPSTYLSSTTIVLR